MISLIFNCFMNQAPSRRNKFNQIGSIKISKRTTLLKKTNATVMSTKILSLFFSTLAFTHYPYDFSINNNFLQFYRTLNKRCKIPHSIKMQTKQTRKQKPTDNEFTIFCYLCREYLISSVTTKCFHTFCEFCLKQYFNFFPQCPLCPVFIRGDKASHNRGIDQFVRQYINNHSKIDLHRFQQRTAARKQYFKRQIRSNIAAGQKIDARDQRYIWREARVIKTFLKSNPERTKYIKFVYLDSNEEEELNENSERIAPIGFFSSRNDLPKYYSGSLLIYNQNSDEYYMYQDQS